MADEKKPIDWAEIERDFRTGTMSIREIARWYGITDTAIRKKAAAGGWVRANADHSSQPSGRREPLPEPAEPKVYVGTVLTPENARPEAIVGRGRNLVLRMLDELEATTTRLGELEALIETACDGASDKAVEAARAAITLKGRADVLKALATAAKTLAESGAPAGKKEERQRAAEDVASTGRFAPRTPPKLVVNNE